MKKIVFRIGDKVNVINPETFVRCGYPLYLPDLIQDAYDDPLHKQIKELFEMPIFSYNSRIEESIAECIGKVNLVKKSYGGNERKIFTRTESISPDSIYEVIDKKIVKTGKRQPAYTDSFNGEYYGACLLNEKTHIILTLSCINNVDYNSPAWLKIEEKNCQKVLD